MHLINEWNTEHIKLMSLNICFHAFRCGFDTNE